MSTRLTKATLVPAAFACVYLAWGSTYLAIRIAGERLSAPVVVGMRCVESSVLLFALCLLTRRGLRIAPGEAWKLVLIGLLFMSGNSMLLTWGEQMVPSGFASLIISTIPIMIALIGWALPGGDSPNRLGWAGTLLGTAGIVVLVWPSLHAAGPGAAGPGAAGVRAAGVSAAGVSAAGSGAALPTTAATHASRPLEGTLVLLAAALCFAVGSVLSRRFKFQTDTLVATGWQLAVAAVFNMSLAFITGGFRHAEWTWRGSAAIAYLAVVGSLLGLVAFTYLLQNVAVTKVATYAFVNPVIAVLLGVFILHERFDPAQFLGMAIIVCAVAMVVLSRVQRPHKEPPFPAAEAPE